MKIVNNDLSAHWYTKDGKAAHDADLRRARKEGLLPSVSTIQKIKSNPFLESWKIEQAILSALTLPKLINEDEFTFAKRVAKDSQEGSRAAADEGTRIHGLCEDYLKHGVIDPKVESFASWIKDMGGRWTSEKIYICEDYAGCVDLHSDTIIADIKTQDVKDKPNFYDSYAVQLAAYSDLVPCVFESYISIVIDRKTGRLFEKTWTEDEIYRARLIFHNLKSIWKLERNYYPEKVLFDNKETLMKLV